MLMPEFILDSSLVEENGGINILIIFLKPRNLRGFFMSKNSFSLYNELEQLYKKFSVVSQD
jgi:hypothetical protein